MDNNIEKMDLSYEEAISRMDEILKKLETGNNKLEESLKLYEEGIKLYRHCNDVLNKAELRVVKLNNEGVEEEVEI